MQLLSAATKLPGNRTLRDVPDATAGARELLEALPPLMRFVRKHMRSHRTEGLSVPQFRTLMALGLTPPMKLSAVADFLGASPPTTSRIVSKLVRKGLVTRSECARDRRQIDLRLTGRGQRVREIARAATQAVLAQELATLNPREQRAVVVAMKSLGGLFAPGPRLASNNFSVVAESSHQKPS